MKIGIIVLVMLLLTTSVLADSVNLLEESEEQHESVSDELVELLNEQVLVHAFIDGYDVVGVEVENTNYVLMIENDSITEIVKNSNITTDYTIKTTIEEVLFLSLSKDKINQLEAIIKLLRTNEVPGKVILNIIRVIFEI